MALEDLTPPVDPRSTWELPPFGGMPRVADLDETVTRVLADNASPMTLDGTNTYVLGAPGTGSVVLVDPGPDKRAHRRRVEQAVADRDAEVEAILVTHHHVDHAEAALPWAARYGCSVVAASRPVAGEHGRVVADGETIEVPGLPLEVVATPGHTRDHISLRLPSGVVLTGDHVLGRGTSVVPHPEGDLLAYLDSLRRLHDLGPDALYPGHGPELTEDPDAVLTYYLEHRAFRERQILEVLGDGATTPRGLVERIYAAVDQRLWPAAEASTRAALLGLHERGQVVHHPDDHVSLP
jgi:glyoxylase-like metal-dependent hydrolase (beta-lactamase superfamily II)